MMIGGAEMLVFMVLLYGLVAFALYWIIRLAVRHGIQDTHRAAEVRRSRADVAETIRRQRSTYGGSDSD